MSSSDSIVRWHRFAEWEAEQLRNSSPDFEGQLRWLGQAWELARRHDPRWGTPVVDEEHVRLLSRINAALSQLRWPT